MRKGLMIIAGLLYYCTAFTQGSERAVYYDSLTYADYIKGDWDALLHHGKMAAHENAGNEWVYKRMGYVQQLRRHYFNSVYYYNKVSHTNKYDADALVMNYNNLLQSGRYGDAYRLTRLMDTATQEYVGYHKKIFESIYVEGGAALSNNKQLHASDKLVDPQHRWGSQTLTTGMYYWQLGLSLRAGKAMQLYIAYNGLLLAQQQQYNYGYSKLVGTQPAVYNGVPYQRNIYQPADSLTSYNYLVQQHQLYLGANIALPFQWNFTPFVHVLYYSYKTLAQSNFPQQYYAQPIDTFQSTRPVFLFIPTPVSGFEAAVGFVLSKQIRWFKPEVQVGYSAMDQLNILQATAALGIYPLANTYFSFTPSVSYVNAGGSKLIYHLDITARLHRYCWLNVFGTYGNMQYWNEKAGALVYNTTTPILYRLGGGLYLPVHRKVELFLNYQYRQMQGAQQKYINNNQYDAVTTTYQNHLITLGLKFNL